MPRQKKQYVPPSWAPEAQALLDAGHKVKNVAKKFHVSDSQIRYALNLFGCRDKCAERVAQRTLRNREARAAGRAPAPAPRASEYEMVHTVFEPWVRKPRNCPVKKAGQICEQTMDAARQFAQGLITREQLSEALRPPRQPQLALVR